MIHRCPKPNCAVCAALATAPMPVDPRPVWPPLLPDLDAVKRGNPRRPR